MHARRLCRVCTTAPSGMYDGSVGYVPRLRRVCTTALAGHVRRTMRIKLVGPCASGKSVLVARLRELGYDASSAAQDHSFVPDMWQRLNPPDVLIYLDVTLDAAHQRGRVGSGWDQDYLDEQHWRLRHARAHCDLYLPTSDLAEEDVLARVLDFLCQWKPSA